MLADDISQLLALGDALDSQERAMISRTIEAVIRVRGMDSLAIAGGVSRDRLRSAIRGLGSEDCALLRSLVARLLAALEVQELDKAIRGDASHSPAAVAADKGLRGP
ncbi:hypothetical protein FJQ54_04390 [Sandaracinobacter neustonicus]|uniref:Uncharacterized protein n=1 Tax=Sandaracinobacter neustonicus TaxID=1715348 RepID=A0A501XRA2_9SPHN|nr:hypothetical protein [Sandaracinobacter neustonicus]TPE63090.1 hypothetical protein FJQ54_04390 [Sandaracinobacter neustonicus]